MFVCSTYFMTNSKFLNGFVAIVYQFPYINITNTL
jgi:hypothetical protein